MSEQNLAEQLRAWRDRRGWTRQEAANALGVPLKTLQDWEQNRHRPTGIGLAALLRAIGEEPQREAP